MKALFIAFAVLFLASSCVEEPQRTVAPVFEADLDPISPEAPREEEPEPYAVIEAPDSVAIDTGIKGEVLLMIDQDAFVNAAYLNTDLGGASVEAGEGLLITNFPAGHRSLDLEIELPSGEALKMNVDFTVPWGQRVEVEVKF